MTRKILYTIFVVMFLVWQSVKGQKTGLSLQNQLSGWTGVNFSDPIRYQAGARYIPTLSPWWEFGKNNKIDAEIICQYITGIFFFPDQTLILLIIL